jgi:uncharacterized membrane protein
MEPLNSKIVHQIELGKKLIISGFIISILGIITYCIVCFDINITQQSKNNLLDPLSLTITTIVIGVVIWIAGSVMHLKGEIKKNLRDTEN